MMTKLISTLALVLALSVFSQVRAADSEKPHGGGGGPGRMAQALLDHADELGLTADQKAKLQDMAKGPMSVLTDDQKEKAKAFAPKGGPGGKMKKDGGDAPKKAEEKAPDEKKPEDPK